MVVNEINRRGGVAGARLRVITRDDQSKHDDTANAVTKLISRDNVVAVIGEASSSAPLAPAPICQSNRVPMITPASTNPEVTKKGDYIFRVCFTDDDQGRALAHCAARTLGLRRVALLTDVKSDCSRGLAKEFEQRFTQHGGQIATRSSHANGDSEFRAQLTAIRRATPEAVFVPGYYTDVGQIAVQAKDLGLTVPLLGGDGWESPKLIDSAPGVAKFVNEYTRLYGATPDAFAALVRSTHLVADTLRRTEGQGGQRLRNAVAATRGFRVVTPSHSITSAMPVRRNSSSRRSEVVCSRTRAASAASLEWRRGGVGKESAPSLLDVG